jgi:hypothetical protein
LGNWRLRKMAAEPPGVRDAQQDHILRRLYDSESNFVARGFLDGSFDWALGDEVNGMVAAGNAMTRSIKPSPILPKRRSSTFPTALLRRANRGLLPRGRSIYITR